MPAADFLTDPQAYLLALVSAYADDDGDAVEALLKLAGPKDESETGEDEK